MSSIEKNEIATFILIWKVTDYLGDKWSVNIGNIYFKCLLALIKLSWHNSNKVEWFLGPYLVTFHDKGGSDNLAIVQV